MATIRNPLLDRDRLNQTAASNQYGSIAQPAGTSVQANASTFLGSRIRDPIKSITANETAGSSDASDNVPDVKGFDALQKTANDIGINPTSIPGSGATTPIQTSFNNLPSIPSAQNSPASNVWTPSEQTAYTPINGASVPGAKTGERDPSKLENWVMEGSLHDKNMNVLQQAGRVPGGVVKGLNNTLLGLPAMMEARRSEALTPSTVPSDMNDIVVGIEAYGIEAFADNPKVTDKPVQTKTYSTAIKDYGKSANQAVDQWTGSFVPEPMTETAQYASEISNAVGEALPTFVAGAVTGGGGLAGALVGSSVSYSMAGIRAAGNEMFQGSGDHNQALISGLVEGATEAIGGRVTKGFIGKTASPVVAKGIDVATEGGEEVLSGLTMSAITGDDYTASDALHDAIVGSAVGGILDSAAGVANSVSESVTKARVRSEINKDSINRANADVSDVQSILSEASESPANAVVAQDSLEAIKKQTANPRPVSSEKTTDIPTSIAAKFGLVPIGDGQEGRAFEVTKLSNLYENTVEPAVAGLSSQEVSLAERASVNPNEATNINPRSLYNYGSDIYLRPGTQLDNNMFTYRGQDNQWYRTSQEQGSMPASGDTGANHSWEGSGIYSALTPYTTDLYGPSGMLSDNPYANGGIDRGALRVNYPIGVVLQQSPDLSETVSPLTRTEAPLDIVPEGTRRIRYDDRNNGYITEVVNNPADVSTTGLIFGRTGINDATPIQYGSDPTGDNQKASRKPTTTNSAGNELPSRNIDTGTNANAPRQLTTDSGTALTGEVETGQYTLSPLIETSVATVGINAGDERPEVNRFESEAEQQKPIRTVSTDTLGETTAENQIEQLRTASGIVPVGLSVEAQAESSTEESSDRLGEATTEKPAIDRSASESTIDFVPANLDEESLRENRKSGEEVIGSSESPNNPQESGEAPTEAMSAEEKADSIWNPVKTMENDARRRRRRRNEWPAYAPEVVKGPGSRGQIYETDSYNSTFGGLSSY